MNWLAKFLENLASWSKIRIWNWIWIWIRIRVEFAFEFEFEIYQVILVDSLKKIDSICSSQANRYEALSFLIATRIGLARFGERAELTTTSGRVGSSRRRLRPTTCCGVRYATSAATHVNVIGGPQEVANKCSNKRH